jgi:hypothetical protein
MTLVDILCEFFNYDLWHISKTSLPTPSPTQAATLTIKQESIPWNFLHLGSEIDRGFDCD